MRLNNRQLRHIWAWLRVFGDNPKTCSKARHRRKLRRQQRRRRATNKVIDRHIMKFLSLRSGRSIAQVKRQ